jgi:hypothetical protein
MQYDVPLDKVYQMLRQHQQAYDLILQRWRAQIPLDQVEVFEQWVRHCWFDDCQEGLQQRQCIPPTTKPGDVTASRHSEVWDPSDPYELPSYLG